MPEAERMAHLVHDHIQHIGLCNLLGLWRIHLQSARFKDVHRKVQIVRLLSHVVALQE